MVVAGNVQVEKVKELAEKMVWRYTGRRTLPPSIATGNTTIRNRRLTVSADVPLDAFISAGIWRQTQ